MLNRGSRSLGIIYSKRLILPVPADQANVSAAETAAVNAMKRKIIIHLIYSMNTDMIAKLKTLLSPCDPINKKVESVEQTLVNH